MLIRQRWIGGALLPALVAAALLASGCGGGSGSSSSGSGSSSDAEPSAEFLVSKGKNEIPKFGKEAGDDDRVEANEVVARSLKAREDADFATQCETLTLLAIEGIPGAKGRGDCPDALTNYAKPLSSSKGVRKDTLVGSDIAAMRVKGDKGYALYHGNDGKDHAVYLGKEDGEWKVASILTIELES
jgi:hypothetical protein